MRPLVSIIRVFAFAIGLFIASTSNADTTNVLAKNYDHTELSREEIRDLQEALAFLGYFSSGARGKWNSQTEIAMKKFVNDFFTSASMEVPPSLSGFAISAVFVDFLANLGPVRLEFQKLKGTNLGVVLPVSDDDWNYVDGFYEKTFEHLKVYSDRKSFSQTNLIHRNLRRIATRVSLGYTTDKPRYIITSGTIDSTVMYAVSHKWDSVAWDTVIIEMDRSKNRSLFELASASIWEDFGRYKPADASGLVETLLAATFALIEDLNNNEIEPDADPDIGDNYAFSGSGFFLNENSDVLTNWHVVEPCSSYYVNELAYVLYDYDLVLDIAVLSPLREKPQDIVPAMFTYSGAKLNQSIIVAGFPLQQLGSGLTITRGGISRIDRDSDYLQLSAPVNPGNSGGPVILLDGTIAGQITSRVTEVDGVEALGFSFGTTSSAIRKYLKYIGVDFNMPEEKPEQLDEIELGALANKITAEVVCLPG